MINPFSFKCLFKYQITLLLVFALGVILTLQGCSDKKETREYKIGFSQCVGSDLWRKTMLVEMKTELSLKPGTKLSYADADNSSSKQIEQVKEMINEGIDLLVISPNEALPLTKIVEETYNKGIPVIVIDRKTSSPLYTAYVGAENYQVGKIAGEYLANSLKGSGNVVEVMGLPGSSPAIERDRGFMDALKEHPEIKVTGQFYGDWLGPNTETQLLKNKDKLKNIDAIFAHNDVMATSARKVLKQLNLSNKIKVIGVDALPGNGGGLNLVSNKTLTASVLYPTGGKEAINIAMRILNKESFSKENILQTVVIDSSNVQLMKLQWDRINSQQSDIERQQTLLADQFKVYNSQRLVLNFIVITLVLAVVFGGLAFHALLENRKINKSLELKNAEILNQRNQLIEMSEKAQAATEAKLNFFTNISHEFRTPLTLILSPLEDLLKNEKVKATAGNNLTLIYKNVYRLLRLVNQLMDYRKIEHKQFKLHATANNLIDFVKEILDSFKHNAEKRNIDLRLVVKESPGVVWFDVNILDKVIFNLLSNALKFTSDNGRIYITISKTNNTVNIEVEDNGLGMTDTELEHIFEQFYQSDLNYSRGSGLGLSLSKELILLHQGNIAVSSKKWQGTTFTITLPLGDAHLTEEEKLVQEQQGAMLYDQIKIYTTEHDHAAIKEKDRAFEHIKDQSVLIIEDNQDLLNYLTEKFEADYEVFTASTGTNGLAEAYEKIPDLIITDVVVPGMSGKNLTQQLKSDIRTSHIPIILLTAQGSIEQQVNGIQSMADVYITKPFNFEYLQANVENLIKNRVILKEHYTSDISSSGVKKSTNLIDKKFLNDFAGIVEHNLSNEHFSVDDIGKAIGISRVQLYRKVKALLNCSITDYILNRRLKKAKYLLNNEEYSISEITYMVGISSPTYFSTIFKNKYGMTPTEYKKTRNQ
ncbi:substrate-binding domain-containing protein [Pedobacter foliorum]|uniref:substrate-binding domain-containing protein n=1 Tax=Pedobacter foliorum TaxID=2739058 RepID=UPI0015675F00|nr:substrate-binding domain-containing protein [Pedobacter foliorum]NRF41490.1 substrate-binding domain-containing protein [Pedobacter foliorum]